MLKTYTLILNILLLILFTVFLVLHVKMGWLGYVSDSEIWSINLAKNISEEWKNAWVFTRPIFYGLLGFAEYFGHNAISVFYAAKIVGLINSLILILLAMALTYRLQSRFIPARYILPLATGILLLVNTGFFNQGYRIRSDLMASSLVLLAIHLTLPHLWRIKPKTILAWFIPMLATPKAILQIIPLIILPQNWKQKKTQLEILLVAITLLFVLYPKGIDYFFTTISGGPSDQGLFSEERFYYVTRTIKNNPIFFVLFIFRLGSFFIRKQFSNEDSEATLNAQKNIISFTIATIILFLLNPDKVTYFLAAYLPLAAVQATLFWEDMYLIVKNFTFHIHRKFYIYIGSAAFFFTILAASISLLSIREDLYAFDSFSPQSKSIQFAERFLAKYPNASYYDIIGLVPERSRIRLFAGPNDPWVNTNTMVLLKQNLPDIIISVHKSVFLGNEFREILKNKYLHLGFSIYVKWKYLEAEMPFKKIVALKTIVQAEASRLGNNKMERFYVLLKNKSGEKESLETTIEELKKMGGKKIKSILAIAPYENLTDSPPDSYFDLFRFDMEF